MKTRALDNHKVPFADRNRTPPVITATQSIEDWLANGGKITKCPPSEAPPELAVTRSSIRPASPIWSSGHASSLGLMFGALIVNGLHSTNYLC